MFQRTKLLPNICTPLVWSMLALGLGSSMLATAAESETGSGAEADDPAAVAEEQPATPPARAWPPRYQDSRFNEDWTPSDWATLDRSNLPLADKIKVVPLNKSQSVWASFGGQVRLRGVYLNSPDFGTSPTRTADSMMLRMRGYADVHLGRRTRIFAEGIYSNSASEINGTTFPGLKTDDDLDFLNLFAEFDISANADGSRALWLGRRELSFGRQRLVSSQNWLNTRRSFAGAGGWTTIGSGRLNAFLVQPIIVVPEGNNTRDEDTTFWGLVYSNREEPIPVTAEFARSLTRPSNGFWEPYLYGLHRKEATFVQGTGEEDRYSLGLLTYGPYADTPFDSEVEVTMQFGQFDSGDLMAWAISLQGGVSPANWRMAPRFWFSLDYASGDSDADDNKLETFDPLYPLSQTFFGIHGLIDRRNLMSTSINADLNPAPKLLTRFTAYSLWRAETADGVYRTNGDVLRGPDDSDALHIGVQGQAVVGYQFNRNVLLVGVATYLVPGEFISETQTNPTNELWLLSAALQWTF